MGTKWHRVTLTASSKNNFATNLTALKRNFAAVTSMIALSQHLVAGISFHPALKYTCNSDLVVDNLLD